MNFWKYHGEEFNENDVPTGTKGFIYKIIHKKTGRWYIGRKLIDKAGTKQIKGVKKKIRLPSDWKTYWSSSDIIKNQISIEGEDAFTREILIFAKTSSQMLYLEECLLYHTDAILDPLCENSNIRTKVYRKWFEDIKNDPFKKELILLKQRI